MDCAGCCAAPCRAGTKEYPMNVIDKTVRGKPSNLDLDRFRLRAFVDKLIGTEELETRDAPIDLADVAEALEGNRRAVLFRKAGPEQQELVGNVLASRSRLARAFDVAPDKLRGEIQRRLRQKPITVEVERSEAPVQEVVLTGDDA